jgi:hypothetical protein
MFIMALETITLKQGEELVQRFEVTQEDIQLLSDYVYQIDQKSMNDLT